MTSTDAKSEKFKPVNTRVRFPEVEERVLQLWREGDIFRRSQAERPADRQFVMFEGPPTANGSPGIHHVLARVFKDLFPRYWTMRGYRCLRKGGWDTQGLPVELEVERELGLATKRDIEEYGIEEFNRRCRESVFRYVGDWERLTERIGFWIDMEDAYVTYDNGYIETCWWIIKQLWDRDLVYRGRRVAPHCPRCVTTLSSHEVALGYQEDTPDPSVYVKFQIKGWDRTVRARRAFGGAYDKLITHGEPIYFLAWTTTPWTLPGNTALAVKADADYVLVEVKREGGKERLLLAQAQAGTVLKDDYRVLETFEGRELVALTYEPLYDPSQYRVPVHRFVGQEGASLETLEEVSQQTVEHLTYTVIISDIVSTEDGTGILHIAPAFGDVDYEVGKHKGLHFVQQVDLSGNITGTYPFAGKFVKVADEEIMQDLDTRGLLYRREVVRHTYPFCWRCDTPLLYYAKASWYIRTTAVKERLLSGNEEVNWYPEHIKRGRFGEWLRNNVDWAVSRERYWGTPLPVWQCQGCGEYRCVGSVQELRDFLKRGGVPDDLHRPYVDEVVLACPACAGDMRRVPEVLDAWFDSGAMPYAQWHYPFENREQVDAGRQFPADYICEAVDQTRGWFYSLHALSTLLKDGPCYRNVICLGHIQDEQGEKMSKSKGNVVDPWEVINAHGADAVRWYLFTATPPGNARRFSADLVGEVVRRFLLTLWNVYAFFVTYANIDRFDLRQAAGVQPTAELDRWIRSELHSLVSDVTTLLQNYNPTEAGRRIEEFVEVLSNWYVRRSRRRFWKSENDADKLSAYATLYTCLVTLSRLLAPFTPFLAEELYQNLVRSVDADAPDSVHLDDWPEVDTTQIDERLSQDTRLAMRISSLGRAARSKARIRVRQPLGRVLVNTRTPAEGEALLTRISDQVQDELNVKEVALLDTGEAARFLSLRPNLAILGPRLGGQVTQLTRTFQAADQTRIATAVLAGQPVELDGFTLQPDEVLVAAAEPEGYAVALEGGYLVVVETGITPELAQEGLARELVHRIQNMRRSAGFDIADRIVTTYQGDAAVGEVLSRFGDYVRQETLSDQLVEGEAPADAYVEHLQVDGHGVVVGVKQAGD